MNWIEIISVIINFVLGGGILMLWTAKAKKDEAVAHTDKIEMDNFRTGTALLQEAIVKPLKAELKDTQKEMRRLRRAIEKISDCEHSAQCPVRAALNSEAKENNTESTNNNQ